MRVGSDELEGGRLMVIENTKHAPAGCCPWCRNPRPAPETCGAHFPEPGVGRCDRTKGHVGVHMLPESHPRGCLYWPSARWPESV